MNTKLITFLICLLSSTTVFSAGSGDLKEAERRQEIQMKAYEIRQSEKHIDNPAVKILVPDNIREAERENVRIMRELDKEN
jgi:hypothetical protein